ncbi:MULTISPECIES: acyltransferase domain-containing protein [Ramlibacter]|uniref:Acyltransferase domain-containing protein n=1 Tax=Ramlibacter aquaticus TaxID=2780094 RepID=A0ABR9SJU2_9BURK|nr:MULTISPECIES: acyltransferase domain-containing protein [Ramlibacter]MBE7942047.1 acyltransferase domain-containing protein [Ramlibacter aquaticus]
MSVALLFSGQGSQHAAMLPWLDTAAPAQPVLQALGRTLGTPAWRTLLDDGACRSRNAVAQPLVTGTALAAWAVMAPLLPEDPVVVAGYSIGELPACAAAGVFTPDEALQLAAGRARLMDAAVAGHDTGMLAISQVPREQVLAAVPGLECAIRIDPDNNVYGGSREALQRAEAALAGRAQFKPICVALASHTAWMRPAVAGFAQLLAALPLAAPRCPVAMNATGGTLREPARIALALSAQLAQAVQWDACMAAVAERRPGCVLEIGGGQALARMWATRHPDIPARSLDDFRSPEGAADWVRRQG